MFTLIAQAQTGANTVDLTPFAPGISPVQTLGGLVEMASGAVLLVGTLAVLFYLLMGAFNWISAGGEKGKIEEARSMITQGIVGIVILASVFVLFGIILNIFGLRDRINIGNYGVMRIQSDAYTA